jgi:hypothetical protein
MRRAIGYMATCIVALIIAGTTKVGSVPSTLAIGAFVGFLIPLVDQVVGDFQLLRLSWSSALAYHQNVRVSVAYLFRIKVDDRYLLVRGLRWPQFQPVGGVYKVFPSARSFLDEIHALDDNLVPIDPVSMDDLRVRVPGRYVPRFVAWFAQGRDRESGPWREFYEEFVATSLLPHAVFPFVQQRFLSRRVSQIRYSEYADSKELFVTDIFELVPNFAQLAALRALRLQAPPEIYWATESEIRRHGAVPGTNQSVVIGDPACWTLEA